jgi:anti-sigma regulatory factor (Ser/Thr protein kinase)
MGDRRQITLAAELPSLPKFRALIDDACRAAAVDDASCYDIKLAVEEACTKIIKHGYAGLEPGSIVLSLQYGNRQLVVRLTDFGHPFEPSEPPAPDAEEALETGHIDGFGLYFIYRSVDQVSYDSSAGSNTLTLIKRLHAAARQRKNP